MRAPFLLVEASLAGLAPGGVVRLGDDQRHHLRRVLRRDDGDAVEVSDGEGRRAPGALRGDAVELTGPVAVVPAPLPTITVVHALPKGRGFDEVVRTLAELGVAVVAPVVTDRTESRPRGDAAARVTERWRSIARSACEQARIPHVCRVEPLAPLEAGPVDVPGERAVVADPGAPVTLGEALADGVPVQAVRLLVGPEGGLTPTEVADHVAVGWVAARAGDTVLRTVHAATVLVAATAAMTGRYSSP